MTRPPTVKVPLEHVVARKSTKTRLIVVIVMQLTRYVHFTIHCMAVEYCLLPQDK